MAAMNAIMAGPKQTAGLVSAAKLQQIMDRMGSIHESRESNGRRLIAGGRR